MRFLGSDLKNEPGASAFGARLQQHRLSLQSLNPMSSAEITGASALYLTPYDGNNIVLPYGTGFGDFQLAETAIVLNSSFHGANVNFDIFAYWTGSAVAAGTFQWSNSTAGFSTRGTGANTCELEWYLGRLVNKNAITIRNGTSTFNLAARQGLYIGGFRTNSAGATCDYAEKRFVSPFYNTVEELLQRYDTTASWVYTGTNAWRLANNNTANRVEWFSGHAAPVQLRVACTCINSTSTPRSAGVGLALNYVSGTPVNRAHLLANYSLINVAALLEASYEGFVPNGNDAAGLGYHHAQWIECAGSADQRTFTGTSSGYAAGDGLSARSGIMGKLLRR